jgi:hypothetical protein
MLAALTGVLGALIGVAATAGVAWWNRRAARQRQAPVAARLLLGEATALRADLDLCRLEQRVLPDAEDRARLLLAAWRDRPEELSELPVESWRRLTSWVHGAHMAASSVDGVGMDGWTPAVDWAYIGLGLYLSQAEGLAGLAAGSSLRNVSRRLLE